MRVRTTRWPANRQLWTLVGGVALFSAIATVAASRLGSVERGQDFMAFYAAGRLAAAGQGAALYDLAALGRLEHAIAADAHFTMTAPVMPWFNPPHAALLFAPLASAVGLRSALAVWTIFGVACLLAAGGLLSRIIGEASTRHRDRRLVLAAVLVSPPTLVALAHGQNTPLSLLLLTLSVVAWRGRRPIAAGVACALLAYKPQLAAVVAIAIVATLGWRAILGLAIGAAPAILATTLLLPGALTAFFTRMPADVRAVCFDQTFCWERHVTIGGFLRRAFHGDGPGDTSRAVAAINVALTLAVAATLAFAWRRTRFADDVARDRLIAAVVLAVPLLMPYFVDYDLLLLVAVAGALAGRDMLARSDASATGRWLRRSAMFAYAWSMVNALVAQAIGVNLTVPLLATLFALQARRCARRTNVERADDARADDRSTGEREAAPQRAAA